MTAAVVAAMSVAALTPALPASAAPAPTGRTTHTYTLLTGDRVVVGADGSAAVTAGPGRSGMRFVSRRQSGHWYVIPVDALALIRDGRIEQDLFDLETLRANGYDDRSTADLPMLVSYQDAAGGRTAMSGSRIVRDLPGVRMLAVRTARDDRAGLWRSMTRTGRGSDRTLAAGVRQVWLDRKLKPSDDVSNPQIGVPAAEQAGLDGRGVTVAVLDTGIDATHPDLAGQIADAVNFTDEPSTDDLYGHGTHVASIIAGTGERRTGRPYRGVAPGAKLLVGKVCGVDGCAASAILAGMEWAAARAPIVNMSFGGPDTPGLDPLEQAVQDLSTTFDTLFVIAAGNDGPSGKVSSPGSAAAALTVGAVDAQDRVADFSSRGPTVGDESLKPDITAPGVGIIAARATHAQNDDPVPADGYTRLSGTSMATPHVAGAAALLAQQHPGWTATQRKEALMGSAEPTAGTGVFEQGAGRVDVARAITQTVHVDGGSVSFGRQAWPHSDDRALTRTVTYRNSGSAPITLGLTIQPAVKGVSVQANTLTVPAGGSASTTLTADTSTGGPDGLVGGHLTAAGPGGVRVETPFGVDKEIESYDVTVSYTTRNGSTPVGKATELTGLDVPTAIFDVGDQTTVTYRLPRGAYGVVGTSFSEKATASLVQPRLVVDHDMTLRMDARRASPVKVRAPRRDAESVFASVNQEWTSVVTSSLLLPDLRDIFVGRLGSAAAYDGFLSHVGATFARPSGPGEFHNSPYLYELYYLSRGRPFNGLRVAPRDSELATVVSSYSAAAPAAVGSRTYAGTVPQSNTWLSGSGDVTFDLPFRRTEHVSAAPGLGWASDFHAESPTGTVTVSRDRRAYRPGTITRESWHAG